MSATPILDLQQLPPKPRTAWLPKLIGFAIGLAILAFIISADRHLLPPWHWPAFNGLLLIPTLYVAIAFHELGHLAAGKLVGLDSGGISVGAFVFTKSGRNWVFRFDRRRWLGGFFRPLASIVGFPASRYAWMVAGGPAASVLFAILCEFVWTRCGNGGWDWIATQVWASLFIAIVSLIPFSYGLDKSDAARLRQLLRYPERARSWMALLHLQTEEAHGVRPREWNQQTFDQILTTDASADEYLYCQFMAFYRRLDEGLEEAALSHLENALARSAFGGSAWQHALFLEAASVSANIRRRPDQARTWLVRASNLRHPESVHVIEAGIAMSEGRYRDAVQLWEAARAHIARRRLDSGIVRFAAEKWAIFEAECRELMDRPSAAVR